MFKNIRWKFITIYFLLVFMAMVIIGVFLMQRFEEYHLGVVSDNMSSLGNTIVTSLKTIDWRDNPEEIENNIRSYEQMGMGITVINRDENFSILFSTNASYTAEDGYANATRFLDTDLILSTFNGNPEEKDFIDNQNNTNSSKHMVFPIHDEDNRIEGAVYLKSNLEDIYRTLEESRWIILRATFLALVITIVIGYFIAKSITGPINDVTVKAEQMAQGDFDQVVEVRSDDEIGQLASMFNHLTARLRAVLQEMTTEKQKMDTIINYMADGLIAVTKEGNIIHINPKAKEMLKIKEEAFKNKSFDQVVNCYNKQFKLKQILDSKDVLNGQKMIKGDNGEVLQASYAPFMDKSGDLEGIILVLQDVTKHQKLENMRKEFVANVSHELKTPLTTIKSYTETLLDGAMEEKQLAANFLEVIDSESERMTRLVRDLLQLSNIDSNQSKWNKKVIDLKEIIEKIILKCDVSAKNKNQDIKAEFLEEDVNIFADEDRIQQVMINILSNSIKYTSDGGKINIVLESENNIATIRIKDNGIGIPEEDLPRIFERFYRVDKARSRELGGTGLGLSIVKEIIESHEGTIEIFSEEGKGTETVIKIPRVAVDNVDIVYNV